MQAFSLATYCIFFSQASQDVSFVHDTHPEGQVTFIL